MLSKNVFSCLTLLSIQPHARALLWWETSPSWYLRLCSMIAMCLVYPTGVWPGCAGSPRTLHWGRAVTEAAITSWCCSGSAPLHHTLDPSGGREKLFHSVTGNNAVQRVVSSQYREQLEAFPTGESWGKFSSI